jgi:uncharacterized protein
MMRVSYFEMSALDAVRAMKFYQKVFKWKFEKWGESMEYWGIETGPEDQSGINGGLSIRKKDNYIVNSIDVDSIDKTIKDIKESGGKIVEDKTAIPGYGYYALFEDTEGNLMSILEEDDNAS